MKWLTSETRWASASTCDCAWASIQAWRLLAREGECPELTLLSSESSWTWACKGADSIEQGQNARSAIAVAGVHLGSAGWSCEAWRAKAGERDKALRDADTASAVARIGGALAGGGGSDRVAVGACDSVQAVALEGRGAQDFAVAVSARVGWANGRQRQSDGLSFGQAVFALGLGENNEDAQCDRDSFELHFEISWLDWLSNVKSVCMCV